MIPFSPYIIVRIYISMIGLPYNIEAVQEFRQEFLRQVFRDVSCTLKMARIERYHEKPILLLSNLEGVVHIEILPRIVASRGFSSASKVFILPNEEFPTPTMTIDSGYSDAFMISFLVSSISSIAPFIINM